MEQTGPTEKLIRFEAFEVDLEIRQLRKRGTKIRLQELPFRVLTALLERPGQVVTREELIRRLWPEGTNVDFEHGLNTSVKKLRAALCDSAEKPAYIETLPRIGYRFIADVEKLQFISETPAPGRRAPPYVIAVALGALLIALWAYATRDGDPSSPEEISIAVLPLQNLSGDPDQEYLSDGITEALISDLGTIAALKVISKTSVMQFKGSKQPLAEIARALKVTHVVEGSVVRAGDQVRVTTMLVDARTGEQLWSGRYERELVDVLKLQSEVTQAIAEEIEVALTPQERLILARPGQ